MIQFTFMNEQDYAAMGIYRIWFGQKYYIGATTNTKERMWYHSTHLYKAFNYGEKLGKNSTSKIVNHLLCNPYIKTAFVELLQECIREIDLVEAEYKWLSPCENDSNCLNYQFRVNRKIVDTIFRPAAAKSFCTKNVVRT